MYYKNSLPIFFLFSFILFSSCNTKNKEISKIDFSITNFSQSSLSFEIFEDLVGFYDKCDSILYIPVINVVNPSKNDSFTVHVNYENFITKNILPHDYESLKDSYKKENLVFYKNNVISDKNSFISFIESSNNNSIKELNKREHNKTTIICSIDDINTVNPFKSSTTNVIYTQLPKLRQTLDSLVCKKIKSFEILIVGNSSGENVEFIEIEKNIDNLNNNNLDKENVNEILNDINLKIESNPQNWLLFFLRARINCLLQKDGFENEAVIDLATSARHAIDEGKEDTLLQRLINLQGLEFKNLFIKERLYKARLDGTLAGLRSDLKEIIDVPLYFLTDHPIEGFTKSVPMVHFEKGQNIKTYVSKGLNKEIIIQIKDFNESNGVVKFDVIDQKTKNTFSEIILNVGDGKPIKLGSASYSVYIRNLSDLKKPFISLSIEQENMTGSIHSYDTPEETVKSFLTYLGESKFKSAYALSDNQLWKNNGGYKWFSSKWAYGGIKSIEINEIVTKSLDKDEAIVMAYYYADDPIHNSRDWKQNFYLLKKNNRWTIVQVKLDSL